MFDMLTSLNFQQLMATDLMALRGLVTGFTRHLTRMQERMDMCAVVKTMISGFSTQKSKQ